MRVSVIIPHYNDLTSLDLCLSKLACQSFPAKDTEIIVADNGSPQGEEAVAKVVGGRARLVLVPQRGAGPARNGGAAAATGEILAFIDSDCVPHARWLESGLAALACCDFAGGGIEVLTRDGVQMSPTEAFECVFAFDAKSYVLEKRFAPSGNLFCPRVVFEAVNGFGTGVSEDVDWSRRATALNFRLGYAPDALIGHPARRTWNELKHKWVRINSETYALMAREPYGRLKWLLRTLALPLSAVAHSGKVFRSRRIKGLRQRGGALAILYRLRFWRTFHAFALLLGRGA
jgi:glycosyltransferase involved in cell wall biosynthesis